MAERSSLREKKRTVRMSEADDRYVTQMMEAEGFETFQSFVEHRLFGRRSAPRRPGPATDQVTLEGLKSA